MDIEKLRKYKNEFDKENYKQFKAKLKPNELENVNIFLKENNMNKRELVLFGMRLLKRKGMMKMTKIEKIEELIKNIKESAIEDYLNTWDENNSMSKTDWELGSKGSIKGFDGENIEYISKAEFDSLYDNLTDRLNETNERVLDRIIEYLEKEQKKNNFNDLDCDCFTVSEFEEEYNMSIKGVSEFLEENKVAKKDYFKDVFALGNYGEQDQDEEETINIEDGSVFITVYKDHEYAYINVSDKDDEEYADGYLTYNKANELINKIK